jgi:hypothetical protein
VLRFEMPKLGPTDLLSLRARRAVTVLAACVIATLACPTVSLAAPSRVDFVTRVSGDTRFPDRCGDTSGESVAGWEVEPHVAVDGSDPAHLVAMWQQDRFKSGGGALANVTGVSRDGGRTWREVTLPKLTPCTGAGGERPRATDPWVAFGADGTAYAASIIVADEDGVVVQRSGDGGASWSEPTVVAPPGTLVDFDDKETFTPDPRDARYAYMAWTRYEQAAPTLVEQSHLMFARTSDGGSSWTAKDIYSTPPGILPDVSFVDTAEVEVLPDGSLVLIVAEEAGGAGSGQVKILAFRSGDRGETWSEPVTVTEFTTQPLRDPETGQSIRAPETNVPPAVAPDGSLYVAWYSNRSDSEGAIRLARSRDGGRSWEPPTNVTSVPGQAFLPAVTVANDGTVGVSWMDLREDRRGDQALTARAWFAHSHDGGSSWEEIPLDAPFDLRTLPTAASLDVGGHFLADYQGVVPVPSGFGAILAQAGPRATDGPTDIFFARIQMGDTRSCLASRSLIGPRNIGRIRLGLSRGELLRMTVAPVRRSRRYYRYCVKDSRGRVTAVFSGRGRVRLVVTTAAGHRTRGVAPRVGARRVARSFPRRRRLGRQLFYANSRIFGIRLGRVRFVAVADRRLLRDRARLRRLLRRVGF